MSYLNPYYSSKPRNINVPKSFTNNARTQIHQQLKLKHGPSPLAISSTISNSNSGSSSTINLSSSTNNNNSVNDGTFNNNSDENLFRVSSNSSLSSTSSKKMKILGAFKLKSKVSNDNSSGDSVSSTPSIFNKLKRPNKHEQNNNVKQAVKTTPAYDNDEDVEMADISSDTQSIQSTTSSAAEGSLMTNQSSLFSIMSNQTSTITNPSLSTINLSISTPIITLAEALPTSFKDMYPSQYFEQSSSASHDGRPLFTKRPLIDWQLNDLRSLLIVCDLKMEWNHQVPIIYSPPGFRIQYLPLDALDDQIVDVLVKSDMYMERIKDHEFRYQIAKRTVEASRDRHNLAVMESLSSNKLTIKDHFLHKYEWRNLIENFLLNLAIEAQCRHDLKKIVSSLKKQRKAMIQRGETPKKFVPPPPYSSSSSSSSASKKPTESLLKKAILNDYTIYSKSQGQAPTLPTSSFSGRSSSNKISPSADTGSDNGSTGSNGYTYVTKDEINLIWGQVQENVYGRLGLNWKPDV
ncbi:Std1 protein [Saccharomycopsis crataegensis]|uniref:Std1 protein n=1 Tax=Saccharomycopsis crataegensis TaxID=43959 RepID=A0AAV5QFU5_9ASCO|nr:Std1 protein [Saccharomycopsis crataegensis]